MTTWNDLNVTREHAEHLQEQAIPAEAAERLGIFSITDTSELPEGFNLDRTFLPAICFPWKKIDGSVEYQLKLPPEAAELKDTKYLWRKGRAASLGEFKVSQNSDAPLSGTALLVEGTKQSIAASHYAPPGVSVYGTPGCWMWSKGGVGVSDLSVFAGKKVIVALDADAATNPKVYDAGVQLSDYLQMYGATSVRFMRIPGGGKNGLDDLLAAQPDQMRTTILTNMITATNKLTPAKGSKPADKRPDRKVGPPREAEFTGWDANGEKVTVVYTDDPLGEIHGAVKGVQNRWDGRKVFNYGNVIARFVDGKVVPQTKDMWKNTLLESCRFVKTTRNGEVSVQPSAYTVDATYARTWDFTELLGVKHAPFVREDGTICTESGYDPKSKMLLHPSQDLHDIDVPDHPTPEQVTEARETLEDWLFDFRRIAPTDADKANMIALAVTPFVRLLLPSCPLAVIDGLQQGVGKNKLADGISIVYNGTRQEPLSLVLDDDEQRKQLTAVFRSGGDFFMFDEAHTVEGKELARALTAPTWSDRQLGKSQMVEYPNQAVWLSLGNNVRVEGDLQRRVYPIQLKPTDPNPQYRDASHFKHPDFLGFTQSNRKKLVTSILTLVRAWFVAGQPAPRKPVTFGSFEVFEKTVGGILEHAGIRGFLENRARFASDSSFEQRHWEEHLGWLRDTFGEQPFMAKDAASKLRNNPKDAETPPTLPDPTVANYARHLGVAYSRIRDQWKGGLKLVQVGERNRSVLWRVLEHDEFSTPANLEEPPADNEAPF